MTRSKVASAVLAVLALSLFGIALYRTVERYHAVLFWKSTEGTVVDRKMTYHHDGEGILRYRLRAAFRYQTPSGEQKATVDSDFASRDYAWVRSRLEQYAHGARSKVYYDPSKHDRLRFGADLSFPYLEEALYYYAGALPPAALAIFLWSAWKPSRKCITCKNKLKHHYRYCPFCGASLSPIPHPIPHERTVET